MKKLILGSTALVGVASLAGAAQASDGVKLDVGGFFQTVFQGIINSHKVKGLDSWGALHQDVRFVHNAEVHFKGETTLDNGLTVGAQIELEGENANDQIDKSFVYWSGGFGKVQIGSQDGVIGACPVFPPGATANFSGFSPASWGSNDPVGSNAVCADFGNSQSIKYTTPTFGGFQLAVQYTPSNNAEDYTQAGVDSSGTPVIANGGVGGQKHIFGAYATYSFAGDGWGLDLGGGASVATDARKGTGISDGRTAFYQTAATMTFGGFAVGGIFEYADIGGNDNDQWVAGGGASYGINAWTVGIQGSHGSYEGVGGVSFAQLPGNHRSLDRVIVTGSYEMGPGVLLDAELGYTWFHDTGDGSSAINHVGTYHAYEAAIGSKLTF